jgi:membrane protein
LRESSRQFYRAIVKKVWADLWADKCIDLAAQMSFYFILSVFPFLLVVASVIGWLPSTNLWHNFAEWMSHYLPRYARGTFFHTILGLTRGYTSFLSAGLIAMTWSASSGFVSLIQSLNIAYEVKETRGFWKQRLIALAAAAMAAIFLLGSFGLLTAGHLVVTLTAEHITWVGRFQKWFEVGRWAATVGILLIGLDLINHFLPDRKRRWRWFTPGTFFVIVLFVGTALGFQVYVQDFADYSRVYGALAGGIILLLWVYAFSLILLVGAEIDNSFERLKGERTPA